MISAKNILDEAKSKRVAEVRGMGKVYCRNVKYSNGDSLYVSVRFDEEVYMSNSHLGLLLAHIGGDGLQPVAEKHGFSLGFDDHTGYYSFWQREETGLTRSVLSLTEQVMYGLDISVSPALKEYGAVLGDTLQVVLDEAETIIKR